MENYLNWTIHGENQWGDSSSMSNVHDEEMETRNPYVDMVIDAMGDDLSEDQNLEEDPNPSASKFYTLLRDADEPLWVGCHKHTKLSAVTQLLNLKSEFNMMCNHPRFKPKVGCSTKGKEMRSQVRNFGHITQIANKLIRLAHNQRHIPARVQEHGGVERDDENYMRRAFKIYLDLLKNLKEMLIKGYENVVWGRAHSRDLADLVEYES
ncbi:hypothetical protein QL285_085995 [Trifolium repens]|nr:hypothetical protein QL285_085995 [Trifolium repens]